MKALVKNLTGIHLTDLDLNSSHDVLLKVHTVGLCRTDLLVAQHKIPTKQEQLTLGHEFSAVVVNDKTGHFCPGQWVGVNPLWAGEFMGLDFDGALCEYISVPVDKVIATKSQDPRLIAYLEPTAASMAVLKAINNGRIAVVGKNRIAHLTVLILKSRGYEVDYLDEQEDFKPDYYDFMIETVFEENVIAKMIKSLKEGGTLVVKSRKKYPVAILASDLVAKEITLKAVNYYDFDKSMQWLEEHSEMVQDLLGDVYSIDNWSQAFEMAQSGEQKKIFIRI